MVAQTALVGADGVVVLHAVAHVGLHVAAVVDPSDAKLHQTVGNAEALDEVGLFKLGMLVILLLDGAQHLTHSLNILRLVRESLFQTLHHFCSFHHLFTFYRLVYFFFRVIVVSRRPETFVSLFCRGCDCKGIGFLLKNNQKDRKSA